MTYPTTTTPFHTWAPAQLAAMSEAMRAAPVHDRAEIFRDMRATLRDLQERVTGAMVALRAGHEGRAAQAVEVHLTRLAAVGELGEGRASRALAALIDQGGLVAQSRAEIAAAKELAAPGPAAAGGPVDPAAQAAYDNALARVREAAVAYENGTNANYAGFQPYDPPPALTADAAAGGGAHADGSGVGVLPAATGSAGGASAGAAPDAAGAGRAGAGPAAAAPPAGPGGGHAVPAPVPGAGGSATAAPSAPRTRPAAAAPILPGPSPAVRPGVLPPLREDRDAVPPGGVTPWRPGQPWTGSAGRPAPGSGGGIPRSWTGSVDRHAPGSGVRDPRSDPGLRPGTEPPGRGAAGRPSDLGGTRGASGPAGVQRPGPGALPLGAAAGAVGRGETRARPSWLLEDDPEAVWFAGLPAHCVPVVEAERPAPR